MRSWHDTARHKARIEIIPMIDVMMFMLVFFVLISVNVIPATGIKTNLPTSSATSKNNEAKVAVITLNSEAHESQTCATTIGELRVILGDQAFPLKWEETTMDDGKPLVVSILDNNGSLFLEFIKTKEGLWAEIAGVICKTGVDLETQFSGEQIRVGPAANWVLRYALRNGGKFTLTKLGTEQLRIATSGWSGIFSPRAK